MKILHVIAQKPQDTGSGVYVKNLIQHLKGFDQALIAGIDAEDEIHSDIPFYPVLFRRGELEFPVVGMSDRMPYESTTYRELRGERLEAWKRVYRKKLLEVREEFKPDIVVSHHLYLLTSMVREIFSDSKVIGVCHATDLRQLHSHDLEREYIGEQIPKVDRILALHREQRRRIGEVFSIDEKRIEIMGLGYDKNLFNFQGSKGKDIEVWYVGKISRAKGVEELLEAYDRLGCREGVKLKLAGGIGGEEGRALEKKAKELGEEVELLGQVEQRKLAKGLRKGHILVLPSYYEGFPMVVVEALACGMEVVVNDLPGLREGLGEGVLDSGRVHFLPMPELEGVDKISPLHRERYVEELRKKLEEVIEGERSQITPTLSELSWEGVGERYLNLMKELCKKNFS
ncbi:glycosyl transferase [Propionigenium maris DSM 9537]|uniref:Glycosyl transferase n=1 Tax=Propionigenium maris DSM 9537 TaxID=1123000 RepID=A0A9W6GLF3_9FUSO|nr:glycosyltransferase family 4 protein [Propionigenium maris]GLI55737.1 glycosyl transferase [Propionigenium maris DSM 9537]